MEKDPEAEIWWIACNLAAEFCQVAPGLPPLMGALSLYLSGGYEARQAAEPGRLARKISCYLVRVSGNLNTMQAARVCKMDRNTIRDHLAAIEDMRSSDPRMDALLDILDAEMRLKMLRARLARRQRANLVAPSIDPEVALAYQAIADALRGEEVWQAEIGAAVAA